MTQHIDGKFVWFELVTSDVGAAKGFYGELLGWTTEGMPGGEYTIVNNAGVGQAGITEPRMGEPAHWHSYVSVPDVDAAAKRAVKAGGKVLVEPFDVPTVGRMAAIQDPQGAVLSLFRAEQGDPADVATKPIGGFYWNELWTRDDRAARAFYAEVVGFEFRDVDMGPMGTYHVAHASGADRGGLMRSPDAKAPPMWLPYVKVDDCDRTVARAQKLGATVLAPASDVPEIGRFSVLKDPTGAVIAVMQAAQA